MIILDGISNPGQPFGLPTFIIFEIITVLAETGVLCFYNWLQPKKKQWSFSELVEVTILMNIASALIALPVWASLGSFR